MDRKAKIDFSAPFLIGAIFSLLGGIFLVVGICVGVLSNDEDAAMLGWMFGGFGVFFLGIGLICLVVALRKKRRQDALVQAGRYVWGEISDYQFNYNVSVNGRHAIVLMVRYFDPNGVVHFFKSRNLYKYSYTELIGQRVKVYVEEGNYDHYYVSLEEMPVIAVEH